MMERSGHSTTSAMRAGGPMYAMSRHMAGLPGAPPLLPWASLPVFRRSPSACVDRATPPGVTDSRQRTWPFSWRCQSQTQAGAQAQAQAVGWLPNQAGSTAEASSLCRTQRLAGTLNNLHRPDITLQRSGVSVLCASVDQAEPQVVCNWANRACKT